MTAADVLLYALLMLALACIWLGCVAAWRLPGALDRLHAVSFVNVAGGAFLAATAFAAEGVSVRSLKILAVTMILVLGGAALSHATGRALLIREGRKA